MSFTLLIGSFARGTGSSDSDVDILRIGHERIIGRPANIPVDAPISYIDYDHATFSSLYDSGSLFLYHCFIEGMLLEGSSKRWETLKMKFQVEKCFKEPIQEYIDVLSFINEYPGYQISYLPYLSNIFKCLKNIGIFRLASKRKYDFEKSKALEIGCSLSAFDSQTLIRANLTFERTLPLSQVLMKTFQDSSFRWEQRLGSEIDRLTNDY